MFNDSKMAESFSQRNNFLLGITVVVGAASGIYLLSKGIKYLSQLSERRQRLKYSNRPCNVCCKILNEGSIKTCMKCVNCQMLACRGNSCSIWIPSRSGWECRLCSQSHESISKSSEWVRQHATVSYLSSPEPNLDNFSSLGTLHPDKRSETPSSASGNLKERIRRMIETTLAEALGGSLDNVSIDQTFKSQKYLGLFYKYHSLLTDLLTHLEHSKLQSLKDLPAWEGETPDMSQEKLRRLIEKIISDTLRLNKFNYKDVGTPVSINDGNLPFFEPKKYQELLATAVLNKIVDSYSTEKKIEKNKDVATDCSDLDTNHNTLVNPQMQSYSISSSSIEPESDCSITDHIQNVSQGNFPSYSLNRNNDLESISSYMSRHTVPLPTFSTESDSSIEENFANTDKSLEDSWEGNWLFRKKRSGHGPVGMLVPCPKEDIKTQIGDRTADELSDLSEAGSDCENNGEEDLTENPSSFQTVNRNIIGGKSPVGIFDELLEQTSLVSMSSLPEGDSVLTETKNDFVLGDVLCLDLVNSNCFSTGEAINTVVDTWSVEKSKQVIKGTSSPSSHAATIALPVRAERRYVSTKDVPEQRQTSPNLRDPVKNSEYNSRSSQSNEDYSNITNNNTNTSQIDSTGNVLTKIQGAQGSAIQFLAVLSLAPSLAIPAADSENFDEVVRISHQVISSGIDLKDYLMEDIQFESIPEESLLNILIPPPIEYSSVPIIESDPSLQIAIDGQSWPETNRSETTQATFESAEEDNVTCEFSDAHLGRISSSSGSLDLIEDTICMAALISASIAAIDADVHIAELTRVPSLDSEPKKLLNVEVQSVENESVDDANKATTEAVNRSCAETDKAAPIANKEKINFCSIFPDGEQKEPTADIDADILFGNANIITAELFTPTGWLEEATRLTENELNSVSATAKTGNIPPSYYNTDVTSPSTIIEKSQMQIPPADEKESDMTAAFQTLSTCTPSKVEAFIRTLEKPVQSEQHEAVDIQKELTQGENSPYVTPDSTSSRSIDAIEDTICMAALISASIAAANDDVHIVELASIGHTETIKLPMTAVVKIMEGSTSIVEDNVAVSTSSQDRATPELSLENSETNENELPNTNLQLVEKVPTLLPKVVADSAVAVTVEISPTCKLVEADTTNIITLAGIELKNQDNKEIEMNENESTDGAANGSTVGVTSPCTETSAILNTVSEQGESTIVAMSEKAHLPLVKTVGMNLSCADISITTTEILSKCTEFKKTVPSERVEVMVENEKSCRLVCKINDTSTSNSDRPEQIASIQQPEGSTPLTEHFSMNASVKTSAENLHYSSNKIDETVPTNFETSATDAHKLDVQTKRVVTQSENNLTETIAQDASPSSAENVKLSFSSEYIGKTDVTTLPVALTKVADACQSEMLTDGTFMQSESMLAEAAVSTSTENISRRNADTENRDLKVIEDSHGVSESYIEACNTESSEVTTSTSEKCEQTTFIDKHWKIEKLSENEIMEPVPKRDPENILPSSDNADVSSVEIQVTDACKSNVLIEHIIIQSESILALDPTFNAAEADLVLDGVAESLAASAVETASKCLPENTDVSICTSYPIPKKPTFTDEAVKLPGNEIMNSDAKTNVKNLFPSSSQKIVEIEIRDTSVFEVQADNALMQSGSKPAETDVVIITEETSPILENYINVASFREYSTSNAIEAMLVPDGVAVPTVITMVETVPACTGMVCTFTSEKSEHPVATKITEEEATNLSENELMHPTTKRHTNDLLANSAQMESTIIETEFKDVCESEVLMERAVLPVDSRIAETAAATIPDGNPSSEESAINNTKVMLVPDEKAKSGISASAETLQAFLVESCAKVPEEAVKLHGNETVHVVSKENINLNELPIVEIAITVSERGLTDVDSAKSMKEPPLTSEEGGSGEDYANETAVTATVEALHTSSRWSGEAGTSTSEKLELTVTTEKSEGVVKLSENEIMEDAVLKTNTENLPPSSESIDVIALATIQTKVKDPCESGVHNIHTKSVLATTNVATTTEQTSPTSPDNAKAALSSKDYEAKTPEAMLAFNGLAALSIGATVEIPSTCIVDTIKEGISVSEKPQQSTTDEVNKPPEDDIINATVETNTENLLASYNMTTVTTALIVEGRVDACEPEVLAEGVVMLSEIEQADTAVATIQIGTSPNSHKGDSVIRTTEVMLVSDEVAESAIISTSYICTEKSNKLSTPASLKPKQHDLTEKTVEVEPNMENLIPSTQPNMDVVTITQQTSPTLADGGRITISSENCVTKKQEGVLLFDRVENSPVAEIVETASTFTLATIEVSTFTSEKLELTAPIENLAEIVKLAENEISDASLETSTENLQTPFERTGEPAPSIVEARVADEYKSEVRTESVIMLSEIQTQTSPISSDTSNREDSVMKAKEGKLVSNEVTQSAIIAALCICTTENDEISTSASEKPEQIAVVEKGDQTETTTEDLIPSVLETRNVVIFTKQTLPTSPDDATITFSSENDVTKKPEAVLAFGGTTNSSITATIEIPSACTVDTIEVGTSNSEKPEQSIPIETSCKVDKFLEDEIIFTTIDANTKILLPSSEKAALPTSSFMEPRVTDAYKSKLLTGSVIMPPGIDHAESAAAATQVETSLTLEDENTSHWEDSDIKVTEVILASDEIAESATSAAPHMCTTENDEVSTFASEKPEQDPLVKITDQRETSTETLIPSVLTTADAAITTQQTSPTAPNDARITFLSENDESKEPETMLAFDAIANSPLTAAVETPTACTMDTIEVSASTSEKSEQTIPIETSYKVDKLPEDEVIFTTVDTNAEISLPSSEKADLTASSFDEPRVTDAYKSKLLTGSVVMPPEIDQAESAVAAIQVKTSPTSEDKNTSHWEDSEIKATEVMLVSDEVAESATSAAPHMCTIENDEVSTSASEKPEQDALVKITDQSETSTETLIPSVLTKADVTITTQQTSPTSPIEARITFSSENDETKRPEAVLAFDATENSTITATIGTPSACTVDAVEVDTSTSEKPEQTIPIETSCKVDKLPEDEVIFTTVDTNAEISLPSSEKADLTAPLFVEPRVTDAYKSKLLTGSVVMPPEIDQAESAVAATQVKTSPTSEDKNTSHWEDSEIKATEVMLVSNEVAESATSAAPHMCTIENDEVSTSASEKPEQDDLVKITDQTETSTETLIPSVLTTVDVAITTKQTSPTAPNNARITFLSENDESKEPEAILAFDGIANCPLTAAVETPSACTMDTIEVSASTSEKSEQTIPIETSCKVDKLPEDEVIFTTVDTNAEISLPSSEKADLTAPSFDEPRVTDAYKSKLLTGSVVMPPEIDQAESAVAAIQVKTSPNSEDKNTSHWEDSEIKATEVMLVSDEVAESATSAAPHMCTIENDEVSTSASEKPEQDALVKITDQTETSTETLISSVLATADVAIITKHTSPTSPNDARITFSSENDEIKKPETMLAFDGIANSSLTATVETPSACTMDTIEVSASTSEKSEQTIPIETSCKVDKLPEDEVIFTTVDTNAEISLPSSEKADLTAPSFVEPRVTDAYKSKLPTGSVIMPPEIDQAESAVASIQVETSPTSEDINTSYWEDSEIKATEVMLVSDEVANFVASAAPHMCTTENDEPSTSASEKTEQDALVKIIDQTEMSTETLIPSVLATADVAIITQQTSPTSPDDESITFSSENDETKPEAVLAFDGIANSPITATIETPSACTVDAVEVGTSTSEKPKQSVPIETSCKVDELPEDEVIFSTVDTNTTISLPSSKKADLTAPSFVEPRITDAYKTKLLTGNVIMPPEIDQAELAAAAIQVETSPTSEDINTSHWEDFEIKATEVMLVSNEVADSATSAAPLMCTTENDDVSIYTSEKTEQDTLVKATDQTETSTETLIPSVLTTADVSITTQQTSTTSPNDATITFSSENDETKKSEAVLAFDATANSTITATMETPSACTVDTIEVGTSTSEKPEQSISIETSCEGDKLPEDEVIFASVDTNTEISLPSSEKADTTAPSFVEPRVKDAYKTKSLTGSVILPPENDQAESAVAAIQAETSPTSEDINTSHWEDSEIKTIELMLVSDEVAESAISAAPLMYTTENDEIITSASEKPEQNALVLKADQAEKTTKDLIPSVLATADAVIITQQLSPTSPDDARITFSNENDDTKKPEALLAFEGIANSPITAIVETLSACTMDTIEVGNSTSGKPEQTIPIKTSCKVVKLPVDEVSLTTVETNSGNSLTPSGRTDVVLIQDLKPRVADTCKSELLTDSAIMQPEIELAEISAATIQVEAPPTSAKKTKVSSRKDSLIKTTEAMLVSERIAESGIIATPPICKSDEVSNFTSKESEQDALIENAIHAPMLSKSVIKANTGNLIPFSYKADVIALPIEESKVTRKYKSKMLIDEVKAVVSTITKEAFLMNSSSEDSTIKAPEEMLISDRVKESAFIEILPEYAAGRGKVDISTSELLKYIVPAEECEKAAMLPENKTKNATMQMKTKNRFLISPTAKTKVADVFSFVEMTELESAPEETTVILIVKETSLEEDVKIPSLLEDHVANAPEAILNSDRIAEFAGAAIVEAQPASTLESNDVVIFTSEISERTDPTGNPPEVVLLLENEIRDDDAKMKTESRLRPSDKTDMRAFPVAEVNFTVAQEAEALAECGIIQSESKIADLPTVTIIEKTSLTSPENTKVTFSSEYTAISAPKAILKTDVEEETPISSTVETTSPSTIEINNASDSVSETTERTEPVSKFEEYAATETITENLLASSDKTYEEVSAIVKAKVTDPINSSNSVLSEQVISPYENGIVKTAVTTITQGISPTSTEVDILTCLNEDSTVKASEIIPVPAGVREGADISEKPVQSESTGTPEEAVNLRRNEITDDATRSTTENRIPSSEETNDIVPIIDKIKVANSSSIVMSERAIITDQSEIKPAEVTVTASIQEISSTPRANVKILHLSEDLESKVTEVMLVTDEVSDSFAANVETSPASPIGRVDLSGTTCKKSEQMEPAGRPEEVVELPENELTDAAAKTNPENMFSSSHKIDVRENIYVETNVTNARGYDVLINTINMSSETTPAELAITKETLPTRAQGGKVPSSNEDSAVETQQEKLAVAEFAISTTAETPFTFTAKCGNVATSALDKFEQTALTGKHEETFMFPENEIADSVGETQNENLHKTLVFKTKTREASLTLRNDAKPSSRRTAIKVRAEESATEKQEKVAFTKKPEEADKLTDTIVRASKELLLPSSHKTNSIAPPAIVETENADACEPMMLTDNLIKQSESGPVGAIAVAVTEEISPTTVGSIRITSSSEDYVIKVPVAMSDATGSSMTATVKTLDKSIVERDQTEFIETPEEATKLPENEIVDNFAKPNIENLLLSHQKANVIETSIDETQNAMQVARKSAMWAAVPIIPPESQLTMTAVLTVTEETSSTSSEDVRILISNEYSAIKSLETTLVPERFAQLAITATTESPPPCTTENGEVDTLKKLKETIKLTENELSDALAETKTDNTDANPFLLACESAAQHEAVILTSENELTEIAVGTLLEETLPTSATCLNPTPSTEEEALLETPESSEIGELQDQVEIYTTLVSDGVVESENMPSFSAKNVEETSSKIDMKASYIEGSGIITSMVGEVNSRRYDANEQLMEVKNQIVPPFCSDTSSGNFNTIVFPLESIPPPTGFESEVPSCNELLIKSEITQVPMEVNVEFDVEEVSNDDFFLTEDIMIVNELVGNMENTLDEATPRSNIVTEPDASFGYINHAGEFSVENGHEMLRFVETVSKGQFEHVDDNFFICQHSNDNYEIKDFDRHKKSSDLKPVSISVIRKDTIDIPDVLLETTNPVQSNNSQLDENLIAQISLPEIVEGDADISDSNIDQLEMNAKDYSINEELHDMSTGAIIPESLRSDVKNSSSQLSQCLLTEGIVKNNNFLTINDLHQPNLSSEQLAECRTTNSGLADLTEYTQLVAREEYAASLNIVHQGAVSDLQILQNITSEDKNVAYLKSQQNEENVLPWHAPNSYEYELGEEITEIVAHSSEPEVHVMIRQASTDCMTITTLEAIPEDLENIEQETSEIVGLISDSDMVSVTSAPSKVDGNRCAISILQITNKPHDTNQQTNETSKDSTSTAICVKQESNSKQPHTKLENLKSTAFSKQLADEEDVVGHLNNLLPGSIAEREHKKWYNAVEMANNPYSKEALQRRLSESVDKPIDIPNMNSPLEKAAADETVNISNESKVPVEETEFDYKRYGRDYYINNAKHASGCRNRSLPSPSFTSSTETNHVDAEDKELLKFSSGVQKSHSWCDKRSKSTGADIFTARPIRVEESDPILSRATKLEYLSTLDRDFYLLPTDEISSLRSISASEHSLSQVGDSLTPSEDSDTIRVYDLKTQKTRIFLDNNQVSTSKGPHNSEITCIGKESSQSESDSHVISQKFSVKSPALLFRGSTPSAFKFLQPKRKLYDTRRSMSEGASLSIVDRETMLRSNGEKSVIEEDVIPALPSVKALAKAFQEESQDEIPRQNRPKIRYRLSSSWKSVDIQPKKETTMNGNEKSTTDPPENLLNEPDITNYSSPTILENDITNNESDVEKDKDVSSSTIREAEYPGTGTEQLVSSEKSTMDSPSLTETSTSVQNESKNDGLTTPVTENLPLNQKMPSNDATRPPFYQRYCPAELENLEKTSSPTANQSPVLTEELNEINSLEWKEDNVEIITDSNLEEHKSTDTSESILQQHSSDVGEIHQSGNEEIGEIVSTPKQIESDFSQKEATSSAIEMTSIKLECSIQLDEKVENDENKESIVPEANEVNCTEVSLENERETFPTNPMADENPAGNDNAFDIDEKNTIEQIAPKNGTEDSLEEAIVTPNKVNRENEGKGFTGEINEATRSDNESQAQSLIEQRRSEIRFTKDAPMRERSISPVLVPGKLKSSIAFFENLKNKK